MVIKQFKFNMDGLMNWIVKIVKKRVMNFIIKELNNEEFKIARKRKIDNRFVFKCFI